VLNYIKNKAIRIMSLLYYKPNVISPVNVASPSMALPDTKAS
jgi:hypothetical protein